ncbi:hypothetical protein T492DRAFT_1025159 [Pavlovales sp. CCMP2436]|nr:hypothetical protein T492DRAFT_1025159 [Pavlovales sp. CCMP2436]
MRRGDRWRMLGLLLAAASPAELDAFAVWSLTKTRTVQRPAPSRHAPVRMRASCALAPSAAELTEQSAGALIGGARSVEELLAAAARIEPPGPPFGAPHLAQDVHQRKRQRLACNALQRLAAKLVGSGCSAERAATLADARLGHLGGCASAPSSCRADGADAAADAASAREVVGSLAALAQLCGEDAARRARAGVDERRQWEARLRPLRAAALGLAVRAGLLAKQMDTAQTLSARHSIRRLLGAAQPTEALNALVAHLPFDVQFAVVALPDAEGTGCAGGALHSLLMGGGLSVDALLAEIPFIQAELLTADGRVVRERRHTAWLAERASGIGALAYSGKLMAPHEMGQTVERIRDALVEDTGERFDCVLCNHYPHGGDAACKWHADPEHGTRWALPTSVVTVGEPRRFGIRPARGGLGGGLSGGGGGEGEEEWQYTLPLYSGDVVVMTGDCNNGNTGFEHAVMAAEGEANLQQRVSLVFKRALLCGGRKGHGVAGEGRRARARARAGDDGGQPPPPRPGGAARTGGPRRGGAAAERPGLRAAGRPAAAPRRITRP